MTIRSRRETLNFKHPFRIRGIERVLLAGACEVVTDEETIDGLNLLGLSPRCHNDHRARRRRLRRHGDAVDRLDRSCERASRGREHRP